MSTSLPRVSVIIPTRNRAERLKGVLDALMSDDYPNKEIVVSDDASTDGTVDLLRSYGEAVRWVSERNGGEFDSRNKALGMATGSIIRNLSDDDPPVPGSLGRAVSYLEQHPEVDILFGQAVNYYVRASGEVILADQRKRTERSVTLENFIYGKHLYVVSETAFLRRRVIEQIGGFDTTLKGCACADYELWARAAHAGLRLAISDHVFVHHYRYETGERQMRRRYRDLLWYMRIIAERYGSMWDKLYVRWVYLPYRVMKYDLVTSLPPELAMRLRRSLWRRRGGPIAA